MASELMEWGVTSRAAYDTPEIEMIEAAANLTLACCKKVLDELDALIADPLVLLRRFRQDEAELRQLSMRPDWLLDGWALLCAMWRDAKASERLAVTREIAILAPILPREAGNWTGIEEDWERPAYLRRRVDSMEDWRTGRKIRTIEARERALALAP